MSDDASFLARWSQRKRAARAGENLPPEPTSPATQPAVSDSPADEPPLQLPALESLQGLDSDYQAFMQARVDEDTKRAALKQLFNDPHFNRMDGLDVYIDDYGKPDPIPAAMLAALNHARGLLQSPDESAEPVAETQMPSNSDSIEHVASTESLESSTEPPRAKDSDPLSLD